MCPLSQEAYSEYRYAIRGRKRLPLALVNTIVYINCYIDDFIKLYRHLLRFSIKITRSSTNCKHLISKLFLSVQSLFLVFFLSLPLFPGFFSTVLNRIGNDPSCLTLAIIHKFTSADGSIVFCCMIYFVLLLNPKFCFIVEFGQSTCRLSLPKVDSEAYDFSVFRFLIVLVPWFSAFILRWIAILLQIDFLIWPNDVVCFIFDTVHWIILLKLAVFVS